MSTIKIRTKKAKDMEGYTQVKALINHPMETGLRKDKKTGEKIPAHFIKEVKIEKNGTQVVAADWNTAISKNPYVSVYVKAASGDKIKLSWADNKDGSDSVEKDVK